MEKIIGHLESLHWKENKIICGVDEVGRGCMAGPVVVAAAILNPNTEHKLLKDSKELTKQQLAFMYEWLLDKCIFSISIGSPRIIDSYNIYHATAKQMRLSLLHLLSKSPCPDLIVIDAMPLNLKNTPYQNIKIDSIIKAESQSTTVAAASIIAKVTRDKIMARMEQSFPGYGLEQHKGYCTSLHKQITLSLKPSIIHRTSFLNWMADTTHEQKSIFC